MSLGLYSANFLDELPSNVYQKIKKQEEVKYLLKWSF